MSFFVGRHPCTPHHTWSLEWGEYGLNLLLIINSFIFCLSDSRGETLPVFSFRRPTPYGNQTDYRIYELNKRLQNWTEVRDEASVLKNAS